jgi:hypothetical protein
MPALVDKHPQLVHVLDELSRKTVNEIANLLRREGVRGAPQLGYICGLAVYIRRMTGLTVTVGRSEVIVHTGADPDLCAPLPPVCRQFVRWFDMGAWPDLFMYPFAHRTSSVAHADHSPVTALMYQVAPAITLAMETEAPTPDEPTAPAAYPARTWVADYIKAMTPTPVLDDRGGSESESESEPKPEPEPNPEPEPHPEPESESDSAARVLVGSVA